MVCASVLPGSAWAQHADFHVVPLPKEVKNTQAGSFELNARTLIAYPKGDKAMKRNAEYLAAFIKEATGLQLLTTTEPLQRKCIRMSAALKDENPEAYNIRVNSDIILLDGASAAGVFYACQTLRKALPMGQATSIHIPSVEVTDEPRFAYRGAHLDVSRHFVTTDSIRRFIDMLALHNINRFHWHLTDDQGWRIEIKKYPKLTEIGSRRAQTVICATTRVNTMVNLTGVTTRKRKLRTSCAMRLNATSRLSRKLTCRGTCRRLWRLIPNWAVRGDRMMCGKFGVCRTMCFAPVTTRPLNLLTMCSRRW